MSGDTLVLPLRWSEIDDDAWRLSAGRLDMGVVYFLKSGWRSASSHAPYGFRDHATMDEAKAALIAAVKELAND